MAGGVSDERIYNVNVVSDMIEIRNGLKACDIFIYLFRCNSSRTFPCSVIGMFLLLIFMISVLSLFTFSPNVAVVVSISDVFSCVYFWLCKRRARSRSTSCSHSVHCKPFFCPSVDVLMVLSMATRNRNGDICFPVSHQSVRLIGLWSSLHI